MKKLIGVTIGALLVSGAVWAAGPGGWGNCDQDGKGFGPGRMHDASRGGYPERMLNHMSNALSLSGEQQAQIEALLAERGDPRDGMRSFRDQMRDLDPGNPDYVAQVEALAEQQSQQMASRMVEHAKLHADIYAVLTTEQQQQFAEMRQQRGWMGRGHRH
ncbi:Spy/CpxP family protein refolding chaperone [Motiliproteus sediminis]|uniref:Spy/CpxP family protein refolding chaperone n=1 Tax=Motiliproteus sediminis TaxID=1468178 RepID=UPI001AEFCE5B|nr:Spy/CpxP family protein refolding chaperone [Motiliproteus sediminis]